MALSVWAFVSLIVAHVGAFSAETDMFCDSASAKECKKCPGSSGKICVENPYKSQAECLDCKKEENHEDCMNAGCLPPDPGPNCPISRQCQGCADRNGTPGQCVSGACLDCSNQRYYQACEAGGCG